MWQFIALIVVGLVQLGLGFAGIEYHLGAFWAFAAIVVAFWFRILLPITIGSFFGAVDVMGWPWYVGVGVALPGLMFIAPSMVMAAIGAFKDMDEQKNLAVEQQPERYWGIITFSVAWVMATLILNAVAGTQGAGNIITVLWLWVAYLAFRGKAQAIATVAKFVMIFQVVVGGIFFIVLLNDPGMQIYLGPPELFLFGLAIPLVAWAILYSWSSSKVETIDPQRNSEHRLDKTGARENFTSSTSLNDVNVKKPQSLSQDKLSFQTSNIPNPFSEEPSESDKVNLHKSGSISLKNDNGFTHVQSGEFLERSGEITKMRINKYRDVNESQIKTQRASETEINEIDESNEILVTKEKFRDAAIAIEYSPEAGLFWSKAKELPQKYGREFLVLLNENPRENPEKIYNAVATKHTKEVRPFPDETANDALDIARNISHEAEVEFIAVYQTLGDRVPVKEVISKLQQKHMPAPKEFKNDTPKSDSIKSNWDLIDEIEAERVRKIIYYRTREDEKNYPSIITTFVVILSVIILIILLAS